MVCCGCSAGWKDKSVSGLSGDLSSGSVIGKELAGFGAIWTLDVDVPIIYDMDRAKQSPWVDSAIFKVLKQGHLNCMLGLPSGAS